MTDDTTPRERPSGALAIRADQAFWDDHQRAALAQIGVAHASNADLAVFLTYAQRTGLDPWARQLYMIERSGRWTIQASIDGLRIVAQRTGDYAGQVGPQWCGQDGVWHDVWLPSGPPAAARVGVLRRGWAAPQYAVALWREYDAGNRMWKSMGAHMLAKCAEALALRKAFPHDLSGVYTTDEMQQADVRDAPQPTTAVAPATPAVDPAALADVIRNAPSLATMGVQLVRLGAARMQGSGWRLLPEAARVHVVCDLGEGPAGDLVEYMAGRLPAVDPAHADPEPLAPRPTSRVDPDDLPHGLQSVAVPADGEA